MNFDNLQIRCSSLGHLMVEPKSAADKAAGNLSETAKAHLIDIYVSNKYGRQTDINNKYIDKGLMVEEDGITLYSRFSKTFFKKNESMLSNDFIKGTPDLYTGESIAKADTVIDIKCSWDIFTFYRTYTKEINNLYYWQLQGYMLLTGALSAKLVYCLIDTPEILIDDEKRKLMYKMGAATTEMPLFIEACNMLDVSMTFKDIPMKERVLCYDVAINENAKLQICTKVTKAREFLNQLELKLNPTTI